MRAIRPMHDMELCFENGVRANPKVLYRVVTRKKGFGKLVTSVNWFANPKRVSGHIDYAVENAGDELVSVSEYRLVKGATDE